MLSTIFHSTLTLALVSSLAAAAPPKSSQAAEREALRQAIQALVEQTPLKSARVTVQVKSLDDGQLVFAQDADELLNPASNVKLFTAAAALARLGPEFRFETEFLTDPDFKEGKAKVLYVRGGGDPTISTERLYGIVTELTHAGLKEIQDLVLDEGYFDGERQAPGYEQEGGDKAYLAPTGALSLNSNAVGVYLRPADSAGVRASVEVEPDSEYFVLDAEVRTGTSTQRRYSVASTLERDQKHQRLEVKGVVPVGKGVWSVWKKIDQPALYFGLTLKELLKARGIKVKGRVRQGPVAERAKLFHLAQSDTLDLVLKKLEKHSSNFVAEQLIKTLGAEERGVPGTTAAGIDVVEEFLEKEVGLARGSYVMKNGSGLNDANRFSAAQTNRLLTTMMARFPLMPEYLSALCIAGKDGTLRHRFEGSDAVGRLRAKTGTLETVSALSGYVQAVGGERFVFSIMVNDFSGRASAVVPYIDALGAAVAASSGTPGGPSAAVASFTSPPPSVVGSIDELIARLRTYTTLRQKADRRSVPFLRTAWRAEKDPAVRAAIAEAAYQSEPREGANVRMLLDSAQATEDTFGRLARAAKQAGLDTPVLPSLVELASTGNLEACSRLLTFVKPSAADEGRAAWLAENLAVVANDAPEELLAALKAMSEKEQPAAVEALVAGLVRAAQPETPWWPALKAAQGHADPATAEFARALEVTMSQRIAALKAPLAPVVATPVDSAPRPVLPNGTVQPAPGG
jgi:D-alanyl-D-alanine carboxypeptidase/D-alanyl-D-alanine-endopeptidase (penicillin-binding protein 4)